MSNRKLEGKNIFRSYEYLKKNKGHSYFFNIKIRLSKHSILKRDGKQSLTTFKVKKFTDNLN